MGDIRTSANATFRDYVTDGIPASGDHDPVKSDIRATFGVAEDRINGVETLATFGARFTTQTVRVRSTGNVAISTALENGDTLNGLTLATGEHVFLGLQTDPKENGLYTVAASGAASRATWADSAAELAHIAFVIQEGSVGAGERWVLPLATADITLGTTSLVFSPLGMGPSSEFESALAAVGVVAAPGASSTYFIGGAANSSVTGTDTVAIGPDAGDDLTTGSNGVYIGVRAGAATTDGFANCIVGFEASESQVDLQQTSVFGFRAGGSRGLGGGISDSAMFGYQAGRDFAGAGMTAIGHSCLLNATGSYNTAVGGSAGSTTITGARQTLVGWEALGENYNDVIAIGYQAAATAPNQIVFGTNTQTHAKMFGQGFARRHANVNGDNFWLLEEGPASVPTGWANTAVGLRCMPSLTTGALNTVLGYEAGLSATAMVNCVAVGAEAARSGVGGSSSANLADCVWVGALAGRATVSGVGDVAVGYRAMAKTLVASGNVGIGDSALWQYQGGASVGIGYTVGEFLATGSDGVYIGNFAARNRLNADRCVYVGKSAGEIVSNRDNVDITTGAGGVAAGTDNVGVGYYSLIDCFGSRVTAIGTSSGQSLVGTAGQVLNSVFIGYASGSSVSQKVDATNSIAIGAGTFTDKDNQAVLGNASIAETIIRGVQRGTAYTVSGLPSAATMGAGARAFVTDATAITFASVVVAGGSNGVPVYSDGTNWRVG